MKYNVALIYGGASVEHEVSLMGYEYMSSLIYEAGYDVIPILVERDGSWSIDGVAAYPIRIGHDHGMLCENNFIKADVAIPLLHGEGGESGEVQSALACAGIPYIGARPCEGAICLDKAYTKVIAERIGIPTARWISFSEHTDASYAIVECEKKIGFPMFIKPRRLGSSIGAYPVYNADDFYKYFTRSMQAGSNRVIVEKLIENKRELECAMFSTLDGVIISPPGEVISKGFYSYESKYSSKTVTVARAEISESVCKDVISYSRKLSSELSLRHLARIDYFLSGDEVIFNEINTFPGFTRESLYPKLLAEMGIHPVDAIKAFVEDAIKDARPV